MAYANVIDNTLVDDDGRALTDLPFDGQDATQFKAQIDILESFLDIIPFGWQSIYVAAVRSLRAIDCEQRNGIELTEPITGGGALIVANYGWDSDHAVLGILSKLRKRSECTCQGCGRTFGVRFRKGNRQTLCNKCHVKEGLKEELSVWVGRRFPYHEHAVFEFDALPLNIQFLVPPNQVRTIFLAANGDQFRYVTTEELKKQTQKMEAIKRFLDEMTSQ
jgi:hypothetical protein